MLLSSFINMMFFQSKKYSLVDPHLDRSDRPIRLALGHRGIPCGCPGPLRIFLQWLALPLHLLASPVHGHVAHAPHEGPTVQRGQRKLLQTLSHPLLHLLVGLRQSGSRGLRLRRPRRSLLRGSLLGEHYLDHSVVCECKDFVALHARGEERGLCCCDVALLFWSSLHGFILPGNLQ